MQRVRQRMRRQREQAELDVTAFMNLMIVLVPVLLLSLVFTHTSVIELNFPSAGGEAELDPDSVQLEVQVWPDALLVNDGARGAIEQLPKADGGYDYAALGELMQALKQRLPDKRDITIRLDDQADYQTLVSVMDAVRSYRTVQAMSVVHAELFPDVSLGDLPQVRPELAGATP